MPRGWEDALLVILPFLGHGSAKGGSAAKMRSEP
jgi:hypothetical protein